MKLTKYIPYAVGLVVIYFIYKQITGSKAKVKVIDNLDIFNKQKSILCPKGLKILFFLLTFFVIRWMVADFS